MGGSGAAGALNVNRITDPSLYATDLQAGSIASAEAIGTHAFIPDPLNLTAGTIASAQAFSSDHVLTLNIAAASISTGEAFSTNGVVTQSAPPPPPPTDWDALGKEDQKVYVYRVYRGSEFLGTWTTEVKDDPEWTQRLNTPGTTTTVLLARSPNTTKEVRATLITQAGDTLQTQDGFDLAVTYETNNSVGEGTDVEIGLDVDIYVHYGEFANLTTQLGDLLTTQAGDPLLVASGAPTGKRVFSGYILDYGLEYGATNGVSVTLASHGAQMSQALIRDGETVVVDYPSQELSTTLKHVLDTNPGKMTYSLDSIQNTGVNAAFKFQLSTKLEGTDSIYGQSPDGWYWYGDVADNVLVFKQRSSVPDHTFLLGEHIKSMSLKRSQEQKRNLIYFVGKQDDVTGISILKKYEDAASRAQWGDGLYRITDRRYSVLENMQRRADKEKANYRDPIWTTTLEISSARYDIETIKLGQMVGFGNIEGAVRDLQLQITQLSRGRNKVTIQVGGLLDRQSDAIEEIGNSLAFEQFQTIPNAPN
ncbi:hypothetical protein AB0P19_06895 [Microbacterium oleivorans]|uniref:hypothetical protein n=1 Tax=Microbacterium oleivorans TaxID=273677 RepID=UPI0033F61B5B